VDEGVDMEVGGRRDLTRTTIETYSQQHVPFPVVLARRGGLRGEGDWKKARAVDAVGGDGKGIYGGIKRKLHSYGQFKYRDL
jgi:hypothetical protein